MKDGNNGIKIARSRRKKRSMKPWRVRGVFRQEVGHRFATVVAKIGSSSGSRRGKDFWSSSIGERGEAASVDEEAKECIESASASEDFRRRCFSSSMDCDIFETKRTEREHAYV